MATNNCNNRSRALKWLYFCLALAASRCHTRSRCERATATAAHWLPTHWLLAHSARATQRCTHRNENLISRCHNNYNEFYIVNFYTICFFIIILIESWASRARTLIVLSAVYLCVCPIDAINNRAPFLHFLLIILFFLQSSSFLLSSSLSLSPSRVTHYLTASHSLCSGQNDPVSQSWPRRRKKCSWKLFWLCISGVNLSLIRIFKNETKRKETIKGENNRVVGVFLCVHPQPSAVRHI